MLINNYHIKEILLYFCINEKNSNELFFFKNVILSLLNNNNPNFFKYDINNCIKSYNNLNKLYLDSNKFILNEKQKQKSFLDILLNNNIYNYSYIYKFELLDICKIMYKYKNNFININNFTNRNLLNDYSFENKNIFICLK